MLHAVGTFVFAADRDLFGVAEVFLGNTGNFRAHRRREKEGIAFLRNICQNRIDAVRESHVQHLVCFIHHHVADGRQRDGLTLHQVQQTSRSGYYDMYTAFQTAYLAVYGRSAIYGQHFQSVDVFGIIVQVTCYLQAKFPCGAKDQ